MYIGIDPGVSGGLAAIDETGLVLYAAKMPATEHDLLMELRGVLAEPRRRRARALLERAGASPQMGVVSAFTYGKVYGAILMALAATAIPFDQVAPAVWQKALGCRSGGDKNVTKRRAQQLFPTHTVTHAIADALLLAEYCRRMEITCGQEKAITAQDTTEAVRGRLPPPSTGKEGTPSRRAEAPTPIAGAPRHGAGAQPQTR